jgi:hypothetical protein
MSLISRLFKIIKKANLEDDMAKRIMYSLSLSKANKMEIEHNLGSANLDMLNAAIDGADDIIEYGSLSVLNELLNCQITKDYNYQTSGRKNIQNLVDNLNNKENYENLLDFLKKAINLFKKDNEWRDNYGGENWAKIAKSLYTLTNLKLNLFDAKEEQATRIKKQIVLELNYFDSLAHNTGSIYTKLVDIEFNKIYYNKVEEVKDILYNIIDLIKIRSIDEPDVYLDRVEYNISKVYNKLYDMVDNKEIDISTFAYINNILKEINDPDDILTPEIKSEINKAINLLNFVIRNNPNIKSDKINTLMDSKDLKDSNQLYSILDPYISGTTRLQFRDALNNFNRFLSPEEEDNKLLELNKTQLSRMSFYGLTFFEMINDFKLFKDKNIVEKFNSDFLDIITLIKSKIKNMSKEFEKRLEIIEDNILKLRNIKNTILPETNGESIKYFYYKNILKLENKEQYKDLLNKINEMYNKQASLIASMFEALIL